MIPVKVSKQVRETRDVPEGAFCYLENQCLVLEFYSAPCGNNRAPTQTVVRVPTGVSMSILRTGLTMVKCERGFVVLHVVKTGAEDLAW